MCVLIHMEEKGLTNHYSRVLRVLLVGTAPILPCDLNNMMGVDCGCLRGGVRCLQGWLLVYISKNIHNPTYVLYSFHFV